MSRIGRQPIKIPDQVNVRIEGSKVMVEGPKGKLSLNVRPEVKVEKKNGEIRVSRKNNQKKVKALHGLTRTLISNMVEGVTSGFSKTLELHGVGYRAKMEGPDLVLTVGFSHPVKIKEEEGITFSVQEKKIVVSGIDKQKVGEMAAKIRKIRPPEPYKGKGIRYKGEKIRRKLGKAAKAIGIGVK